jgi:adenylate kinase family enzyme
MPTILKAVTPWLNQNVNMPEQIINQLVQKRLKQPDAVLNGWVLEGFPMNLSQINLLTAMRCMPDVVF